MDKAIYTTGQVALSQLLRELREDAGLRQVDVAERLNVPQSFVSKYESGERRLDLVELRQIGLALGVSVAHLVDLLDTRLRNDARSYDERAASTSDEPAGAAADAVGPPVDESS